jgi:hypothetical protein
MPTMDQINLLIDAESNKVGVERVMFYWHEAIGGKFTVIWEGTGGVGSTDAFGNLNVNTINIYLDGEEIYITDNNPIMREKSVTIFGRNVYREGNFELTQEQASKIMESKTLELSVWRNTDKRLSVSEYDLSEIKRLLARPTFLPISDTDPIIGTWKSESKRKGSGKGTYYIVQIKPDGTGEGPLYEKNGTKWSMLGITGKAIILTCRVYDSEYYIHFNTLDIRECKFILDNGKLISQNLMSTNDERFLLFFKQ